LILVGWGVRLRVQQGMTIHISDNISQVMAEKRLFYGGLCEFICLKWKHAAFFPLVTIYSLFITLYLFIYFILYYDHVLIMISSEKYATFN